MKLFFVVFLLISPLWSFEKVETNKSLTYTIQGNYDDVIFALLDEISTNGFILSYRANIGKSAKNTAKLLNEKTPFRQANKIGFCKSSLTLKMMQENPRNILYCPISLAIYETKKDEIEILYLKASPLRKNETMLLQINKEVEKLVETALSN